jgi:hypothetical protein
MSKFAVFRSFTLGDFETDLGFGCQLKMWTEVGMNSVSTVYMIIPVEYFKGLDEVVGCFGVPRSWSGPGFPAFLHSLYFD